MKFGSLVSTILIAIPVLLVQAVDNVQILTPDNFDTIVGKDQGMLIEFFAPWCGHCKKLAPTYEELGDAFAHAKDKVLVASVDADAHKSLGSRFGVKGFPTLKWFPAGSQSPEDYKGGRSLEVLAKFITEKSSVKSALPEAPPAPPTLVTILTPDNFDGVLGANSDGALVEFFAPWCGHCKKLAPTYEDLAKAYESSKVIIASVDADEHKSLGGKFDVKGFPTIKWFPPGKTEPVDYKGGRSIDALKKFVEENKLGGKKVEEVKNPAPVVDSNTFVTILTPDNFDTIVGKDQPALIEFFAPWCGHCKKLAPTYEELAKDFKDTKVIIASVDADDHRSLGSRFGVTGFPTIKYFPKGSLEPVDYKGGRGKADFTKFLTEKGFAPIVAPAAKSALGPDAGKLDVMTAFVQSGDMEGAVAKAKELNNQYADYYVKVFEKKSADAGHVPAEKKRLEGLMGGDITAEKRDEMTWKSNILGVFESKEKVAQHDEL